MRAKIRSLFLVLLFGALVHLVGDGCGTDNHSAVSQDDLVTGPALRVGVAKTVEGDTGGGGHGDIGAPPPPPPTGTEGFTVECWVKVGSVPGQDPRILRCVGPTEGPCGDTATHVWELLVCKQSCSPGVVGFSLESAGACHSVLSTVSITDGSYHHVAGVYNASGAMRVYVDGVEQSTSVPPSLNICVAGGTLRVGNATAAPPLDNPFDGEIDELRVWNVARSHDEIVQNMTGEVSPTPTLVGYWRFNGSGVDLASGNTLVASGSVTFVAGHFGQAVDVQNPPSPSNSYLSATALAAYSIGSCNP